VKNLTQYVGKPEEYAKVKAAEQEYERPQANPWFTRASRGGLVSSSAGSPND